MAIALKTGAHTEILGIPQFQVLTITTKPGHVEKMQRAYQEHIACEPLKARPFSFLFGDFESIARHNGDLLTVPFVNGVGKEVLLG